MISLVEKPEWISMLLLYNLCLYSSRLTMRIFFNDSMYRNIFTTMTIAVILFVCAGFSYGETLSDQVTGHIEKRMKGAQIPEKIICVDGQVCKSFLVKNFYMERKFRPAWSDDFGPFPYVEDFLEVIRNAHLEGLRPEDYYLHKIELTLAGLYESLLSAKSPGIVNLAEFDLMLSDAFLLYASHLLHGRVDHRNVYPGWVIYQRSADLTAILHSALDSGEMEESLEELMPFHDGYAGLKGKLLMYRRIAAQGGWPQIPQGTKMKKGSHGSRVALMRQRLSVTGDLVLARDQTDNIFDVELEKAVKRFQERHGLKTDGTVGRSTLEALNIPIGKRIQQIALNMDRMRWLPDDLGERYVFVNIADFHLEVVEDDREVMTMKIIVGKHDWRSCVLSGKMTYLELNPYWKVPDSIAEKEILPQVKKDPEYLEKKKIKMFRNWNDQRKEIDPKTIDWSRIRKKNFPYKFRQEPGPGNPLGRIKFIFPNECEIYLHDTPTRHLFGRPRRDFSHGCIRIEKPMELASYLLQDKKPWTRKKILAEIGKGTRQVVMISSPLDVHIFYGTAWVDRGGNLQFRNDIYHIDEVPYSLMSESAQTAGALQ